MNLYKYILEKIQQSPKQRIPFSTYMDIILYHSENGYYNREQIKVGRSGDFYTNSSVHSIYGRVWANRFIQAWDELGLLNSKDDLIVMEVGGGNGDFAKAVLEELKKDSRIYDRLQYVVCEQSPYHLSVQQQKLLEHQDKLIWYRNVQDVVKENNRKPSIIFSNELFDALPVDRIKKVGQRYLECWVTEENDQLIETWVPLERDKLLYYLEERKIDLPQNHEFEICLSSRSIYQDIAESLDKGYIFTVDYGYLDEEFLHPARKNGTLIGYFQHQHITEYYQHPGEFDMTAHVHFEDLIRWGDALGIQTISLMNQRDWLMEQNIFTYLQGHQEKDPFSPIAKQNRAIMQLAMGGMGSTFKVLSQKKCMKNTLQANAKGKNRKVLPYA